MMKRNSLFLAIFILVCVGLGLLGGMITMSQIPGWYSQLQKPMGTPPNWIFGPVWTTLYVMMAVAAWRIWKKEGFERRAFSFFGLQFLFNMLWSIIFFGLHRVGMALIDILLLEITLLMTLRIFWKKDVWAGRLLVPYAMWVAYATYLNASIWKLNS